MLQSPGTMRAPQRAKHGGAGLPPNPPANRPDRLTAEQKRKRVQYAAEMLRIMQTSWPGPLNPTPLNPFQSLRVTVWAGQSTVYIQPRGWSISYYAAVNWYTSAVYNKQMSGTQPSPYAEYREAYGRDKALVGSQHLPLISIVIIAAGCQILEWPCVALTVLHYRSWQSHGFSLRAAMCLQETQYVREDGGENSGANKEEVQHFLSDARQLGIKVKQQTETAEYTEAQTELPFPADFTPMWSIDSSAVNTAAINDESWRLTKPLGDFKMVKPPPCSPDLDVRSLIGTSHEVQDAQGGFPAASTR
jgi:hypothetical protein